MNRKTTAPTFWSQSDKSSWKHGGEMCCRLNEDALFERDAAAGEGDPVLKSSWYLLLLHNPCPSLSSPPSLLSPPPPVMWYLVLPALDYNELSNRLYLVVQTGRGGSAGGSLILLLILLLRVRWWCCNRLDAWVAVCVGTSRGLLLRSEPEPAPPYSCSDPSRCVSVFVQDHVD